MINVFHLPIDKKKTYFIDIIDIPKSLITLVQGNSCNLIRKPKRHK